MKFKEVILLMDEVVEILVWKLKLVVLKIGEYISSKLCFYIIKDCSFFSL